MGFLLNRIFGKAAREAMPPRDLASFRARSADNAKALRQLSDGGGQLAKRDAFGLVKSILGDTSARDNLPPQLRELNDRMLRSFEAAWTDRYNVDLRGTYGSANAEALVSDYRAVANDRTVCKDAAQGAAIIRTYQNNVVGHRAFRLKMRVGKYVRGGNGKLRFEAEEDTNRQIERWYAVAGRPENWSVRRTMSRMEGFRIMEASAIRDGRIILRRFRGFAHNPFGYAVDLLEQDHLQATYMGRAEGTGNPIRFSIEFDPTYNFPVAYWLLTRHPGEPFGYYGPRPNTWRERVPAEDIILYNNLRNRAELDVGFTELAPVIQPLHRIRQYNKALTLAAIASCCKPYWIKKNFPTGMQYTAEEFGTYVSQAVSQLQGALGANGAGADSGATARQERITQRSTTESPAQTLELPYGEELMQLDPKFPLEAAHEFREDNDREAAVGAGVSYTDLSGNFQNLGFSASRMSRLPAQDNYRVRQKNMVDNVVHPEFGESLRSAIMVGQVPFPLSRLNEFYEAAHFQGVRWESANPLQDAQAIILYLEAGIISPQQVQDQLPDGVSIDDLYAMIEEANEMQEDHNINFSDADVTKPTVQQGEPGQTKPAADATGTPQPEPASRPANPVRRRSRIKPETLALLTMQGDGTHRNGTH